MSFLKRLGLVEDNEPEVQIAVEQVQEPVEVEVDAEINSATNVMKILASLFVI